MLRHIQTDLHILGQNGGKTIQNRSGDVGMERPLFITFRANASSSAVTLPRHVGKIPASWCLEFNQRYHGHFTKFFPPTKGIPCNSAAFCLHKHNAPCHQYGTHVDFLYSFISLSLGPSRIMSFAAIPPMSVPVLFPSCTSLFLSLSPCLQKLPQRDGAVVFHWCLCPQSRRTWRW